MKSVFIFPPLWNIQSPSTGIPTLMGVLSDMGVDCIAYDLNIDFFNYILKPKHIIDSIEKSKIIIENKDNKYSQEKVNYVKTHLENHYKNKNLKQIINKIENISNIIKNKEKFNDYKIKTVSGFYTSIALDIIFLPYYPYKISKSSSSNINQENINPNEEFSNYINIAEDEKLNIYLEYMVHKIPDLEIENGDLVCISINSTDQILGALTAIKIIRKLYKVKIAIGGSWIDYEPVAKENKKLYTDFTDYCMTGLGEIAVKELWEHHTGQRELKDVSNILYFENDNICQTKIVNKLNKKFGQYNYKGYDFSQYYMAYPVLPIKVSYGCYWGKCKFCNYNLNKIYDPRSADDVIQEIEKLIKQYNVKFFYFQDSALSPKFIEEFADKIISKKIDIRYLTNLRFEKEFDKKLLKKLYKSGLRVAQWGLESGSQKILDKYQKGINIPTAIRILKDSYNVGIYNYLYLIYNFAGETMDDFMMTINFIHKYKKEIKSFAFHEFHIFPDTYIYKHPEEFSIDTETLTNKNLLYYSNTNDLDKKKKIIEEEYTRLNNSPQYILYSCHGSPLILPIIDKFPIKYLNIIYNYEKIKNKIISIFKKLRNHK